jgi:hypothetical protein
MDVGAAAIGAQAVGGIWSANQSRQANQDTLNWTWEFARNAHQLEVEDLKAAGLNPILSAGGKGAQGSVSQHPIPNPFGNLAASALQYEKLEAEIEQVKANTSFINNKSDVAEFAGTVAQFMKGWINQGDQDPEKLGRRLSKHFGADLKRSFDQIMTQVRNLSSSASMKNMTDSFVESLKNAYIKSAPAEKSRGATGNWRDPKKVKKEKYDMNTFLKNRMR